jgi:hypothetical protein
MLRLRGVYRVLLVCRIILLLLRILGVGGYHQLVTTQSGQVSFRIIYEREIGGLTYSLNPRIHRRVG